jgi:hypothetical protein
MSDKTPKPFHIGTKVRQIDTPYEWVVFAELDGPVFVTTNERDAFRVFSKEALVHADDGSPLGEWEPIRIPDNVDANTEPVYRDGDVISISVAGANAIIRGEVEQ